MADPTVLTDPRIRAKFWERVDQSAGPDSCWPWRAAVKPNGYGVFEASWIPRVKFYAHRAAFIIANGSIPEGLDADHECHNRDGTCGGGWDCKFVGEYQPKEATI